METHSLPGWREWLRQHMPQVHLKGAGSLTDGINEIICQILKIVSTSPFFWEANKDLSA
jgi:hypothetical protein